MERENYITTLSKKGEWKKMIKRTVKNILIDFLKIGLMVLVCLIMMFLVTVGRHVENYMNRGLDMRNAIIRSFNETLDSIFEKENQMEGEPESYPFANANIVW